MILNEVHIEIFTDTPELQNCYQENVISCKSNIRPFFWVGPVRSVQPIACGFIDWNSSINPKFGEWKEASLLDEYQDQPESSLQSFRFFCKQAIRG